VPDIAFAGSVLSALVMSGIGEDPVRLSIDGNRALVSTYGWGLNAVLRHNFMFTGCASPSPFNRGCSISAGEASGNAGRFGVWRLACLYSRGPLVPWRFWWATRWRLFLCRMGPRSPRFLQASAAAISVINNDHVNLLLPPRH